MRKKKHVDLPYKVIKQRWLVDIFIAKNGIRDRSLGVFFSEVEANKVANDLNREFVLNRKVNKK